MMPLHIFRPAALMLLRLTVALAALCAAIPAAATPWNGVGSLSLECLDPTLAAGEAGSAANPYFIASGGDLCYLQRNPSLWGKCFRQTANIDMGGLSLDGMIGYGTMGSTSAAHAFTGTYDGCGYTISNLTIDWSLVDNEKHLCFGLFGHVYGATIRNINMVGPRLVREKTITNNSDVDIKLSLLVGSVATNGTSITNISIVDGLITDSGQSPEARTLFVGAIAADLTSLFENAVNQRKSLYGDVTIANISVDCDIDLGASQRTMPANTAQYVQFNVGGVLGRARRPRYSELPVNTYFSGDIKAPAASISPTIGHARGNGDATKSHYLVRAYAGEVLNSDEMTSTSNDEYCVMAEGRIVKKDGTTATDATLSDKNPDANHYFGPYRIYDYAISDYVTIDASTPSGTGEYGVRTLNTSPATTFSATDPLTWRCVQGVSHGSYAAPAATGNAEVLDMFKTYAEADDALNDWIYSAEHQAYMVSLSPGVGLTRTTLMAFTAEPRYLPAIEMKYHWETLDPSTGLYVDKGYTASTTYTFTSPDSPDLYSKMRVTVCRADDDSPLLYNSEPVTAEITVEPIWVWGELVIDKVMLDATSFKYVASAINADGTLFMGGDESVMQPGYTWVWEVSSDPGNGESWETTDFDDERNWIQPYRTDRYYRASLVRTADDAVVLQQVRGPKKMIYLYDADMTTMGREVGVTTFDGIDLSLPLDPTPTYYPDGDDRQNGRDPRHAVRTMERAYQLADAGVGYDDNIIVVMGYYSSPTFLDPELTDFFRKNVTITGNPTGMISGGAVNLSNWADASNGRRIFGGHTKLEKLTLVGYSQQLYRDASGDVVKPTWQTLYLYCELHDLYVGEGVRMIRYNSLSSNNGQITGKRAPAITLVGGYHDRNVVAEIAYPEGNATPGVTTITLNSGCWGRIIGGSRNNKLNTNTNNLYGSPENPHRVTLNISISHPANLGPKEYTETASVYDYDIGLVAGGQTDGTIYGDCVININGGTIGRILSGNISFGRAVAAGLPPDSFFGSCEVTLTGGQVEELYGGTLGRLSGGSANAAQCEAYFYGRSIININGGTVGSNIYGAGAGGVTGVGHCDHEEHHGHHTSDPHIPYYHPETGQLVYGDFYAARQGTLPVMTLRDGTELDFDDSYCEVNINSGTINGDIYGGGHGYSAQITNYEKALTQAGDLFGRATVTMRAPFAQPPVVKGNIYGGGAGDKSYYKSMVDSLTAHGATAAEAALQARQRFGDLARVFGNTRVELYGGRVEGNVYGGSMGVGEFDDMATVFGNTSVVVDGATVNGNIFGGCAFANVKKGDINPEIKGNTSVEVRSGTIGNNIFGGSEGSDAYTSLIEGNASVSVMGGSFLDSPEPYTHRDPETGITAPVERTFNIYGGSYHNGTIDGTSTVYLEKSLLTTTASLATVESTTPADPEENYRNAIDDISYRRFCVYGAGYGQRTLVKTSSRVHINVKDDLMGGVILPTADFPQTLVNGQTFFDVAGGGYNGEVGQWMTRVADAPSVPTSSLAAPTQADYHYYEGGDVYVTIEGSPFIRKVIGGGFYASVNNAETWVKSGTVKSAFGGGLLGYVHNNARMAIGSRARLEGESLTQRFTTDPADAALTNSRLFIVEDVYGGNDVTGIVGTELWAPSDPREATPDVTANGGPLFVADISPDTHKGIMLNLYGGTVGGDVYGAGNGNYRGYYVPEWTRYNQGSSNQYRWIRTNKIELDELGDPTNARTDEHGNTYYVGRAYRARPMAGSVKLDISGNGDGDRVQINGNVYGGGRSCTIGQWNTMLPFEDPRRLSRGGYLQMNIGSHVTIARNLFLGARGTGYNTPNTVPAEVAPMLTPGNHYGDNYSSLKSLGAVAYDHWWWNTANNRYEPGFPPPGQTEGNYGYTGEHAFRGYMKNIEMNGDVELTFYNDLYKHDASGLLIYDAEGNPVRKGWVPGEQALRDYDSSDVMIGSFYLGGECGSMTNNNVMRYDYDLQKPVDTEATGADIEGWGSIYRVTIPAGVTLNERVVAGSENATAICYPYSADFTSLEKTKPDGSDNAVYTFEGGVVTQSNYSYDLIVYCDRQRSFNLEVEPTTYLMEATDPAYDTYTLTYGPDAGTTIRRQLPALFDGMPYEQQLYSLAVTDTPDGEETGYIGARESRDTQHGQTFGETAVKMSLANNFLLLGDAGEASAEGADVANHLYGGLIYGGCYYTGSTMGHVILNVGSNLLGPRITSLSDANFGELSSLAHNIGRVFGGGFGENTLVDGNTYINLLHNFKGMNVFGGGCRGQVTGSSNIVYLGSEEESYIYGAIYGGGLQGHLGTDDETIRASNISLYSGNVDKVYGGSCMGNIYGGTFVELCDQVTQQIDHLDYDRLLANMGWDSWSGSRLIVGSVYGGNDVSGTIEVPAEAEGDYAYETTVRIYEVQDAPSADGGEGAGPGKTSPGSDNGYNGFPLVGNLYGGSNGNYGVTNETLSTAYMGGTLTFATGESTETIDVELGGVDGVYDAFEVPHIERARVILNGGTIINAYGGGNNATVTGSTTIEMAYNRGDDATHDPGNRHARAGFADPQELSRMWHTLHLSSEEQIGEVVTVDPETGAYVFDYQVFRLFGGNENATMAIQPTWLLQCGHIGSIYSGGNFGRMTYRGLRLSINSRNLWANSVYGGGRVGDIDPVDPPTPIAPAKADGSETFYGATLDIYDGVIDHVYGGNDVSGTVYHGTNVNIHGAISGDVYCAGNGNYRYLYDPTLPAGSKIQEEYDDAYGGRYFRLPLKEGFGGTGAKSALRLLALNSYRPNVDQAWLNISGTPESRAYVRGNVYCGGNSATIVGETVGQGNEQIRFTIGDYVTLNGVFMGSNGYSLAEGSMMYVTEQLNNIDLTKATELTEAEALATPDDHDAADPTLYPTLLDLYMRAVDVNGLPSGFNLDDNLTEAYIGDFYVGGNRGSMLTDNKISLVFPSTLVVYGKIVGGSDNANLTYKGTSHVGGLTRPLAMQAGGIMPDAKVHLTIKNRFEPWKLIYPVDSDERAITMEAATENDAKSGLLCFPDRLCNVYGGCYNSGRTVGDIRIDLLSDMTAEYTPGSPIAESLAAAGIGQGGALVSKRKAIVNGIDGSNALTRRAFDVIGGGYGAGSEVHGNITVRLLPMAGTAKPSAAALFGGMQEGTLVGNTRVELRDGQVLTNLYGASEAAPMYGSTQIIAGYPDYYVCDVAGTYTLTRTDNISRAATGHWVNDDAYATPVIKSSIGLRAGDIVSRRVYDIIADAAKASKFTLVDNELPSDYGAGLSWDDIQIAVGDPGSKTDPDAEYLAHGNIYGGGFVSATSATSLAGQNTVCSFNDDYCLDAADEGLGGNSTILVWDNKRNARFAGEVTEPDDGNGAAVRDHIDIGTGHYIEKTVAAGTNVMGMWKYIPSLHRFEAMPSHVLTEQEAADERFFTMATDGGIYGEGRKVFVENFRDVDIACYGYAEGSPQYPKLINTAQHIDLLTFADCCVHLQGANDFATNSVDAANYSLTRVGELQMLSSLPVDQPLDRGDRDVSGSFNTRHTTARSRNFLSFYNDVRYVGAITSNTSFSDPYHDCDGLITDPATTYRSQKQELIDGYYSVVNDPSVSNDDKVAARTEFDRRNAGTAPNMIGINNGYVLTLQGVVMRNQGETQVDQTYYGPVTGVLEVKLLTLTEGEGGGYIFGLNHHDSPASFLEATGNFVFPGAAYTSADAESHTYNYIRDDCFPVGKGWENYWGWDGTSTYAASQASGPGDHGDCNELQECHYWYVAGTKYYYNLTLTAFTSNLDEAFTIDNSGGIIYLYGVEPGSKLTVKEVTWEPSGNTEPDLTFSDPADRAADLDYRFYLTVDEHPELVRTPQTDPALGGNWYVTAIPRADYADGTGTVDTAALPTTPDDPVNNTFGAGNVPQVGISLVDHNHDNTGRDYYDAHLANDEQVRIVLTSGEGSSELTYTINLTVRYLLGPSITGTPVIENCALPGEYVYANSFGVVVDLDDDNMSVNGRNWYLASPAECEADGTLAAETANDIIRQLKGLSSLDTHVAESLNSFKFGNDRQVHIPAYLYLDGWKLIYEVVINGKSFVVLPDGDASLTVHNYHRMRPYDGTSILTDADGHPIDEDGNPVSSGHYVEKLEDLKLIAGSRIYIEDQADMAHFFTWLRKLQDEPTRTTADGRPIDPRYAEGLYIYLMDNVAMPDDADASGLVFKGTFHGGGHYIDMGDNTVFVGHNRGAFYNTGFVSSGSADGLAAFATNGEAATGGTLENCFFYNASHADKGTLLRATASPARGSVVNCFETNNSTANKGSGLRLATYDEFSHGEIAFNLNRFYLKKRYNLATDTPDGELLAPLLFNYGDGAYRYARWSSDGNALALRTEAQPNYHDYRGVRITLTSTEEGGITGANATFHNVADLPDETRLVPATGVYYPIYPADFLFFGQDLSQAHAVGTLQGVPVGIDETNRVYRASGYHGDTTDLGYHFNTDALAADATLTAIDLAGYRDRQLGMAYHIEDEADAIDAYHTQQPGVYYPPMLDLPDKLATFATGDGVTHNLLVYVPDDAPARPQLREAFKPCEYTRDTPEADIRAHVLTARLDPAKTTAPVAAERPDVRLLHLVDRHNFHCPVAFEVTDTAWYQREPQVFSTYMGDAWEGLCLPFDARTVWATVSPLHGITVNPIRDRGELSHFYGPDDSRGYYRLDAGGALVAVEGYENEAPSHEYWLRKFTDAGVVEGTLRAFFGRPDGDDDATANASTPYKQREAYRENYLYSNPSFSTVYGAGYTDETTHSRPCYTPEGAVYGHYPVITAGLPYIVAYPGRKFYEFDMSGEFYADRFAGAPVVPQLVTYASTGHAAGGAEVVVPVTTPSELLAVEHEGYTFRGTFMRLATAASATMAVIEEGAGNHSRFVADPSAEVEPFRTYLRRPEASLMPIKISGRTGGSIEQEMVEPDEPDPDSGDPDQAAEVMEIYVEFNELVIDSPWETDLTVYNFAGQFVADIHVAPGINRYGSFAPGNYVVLTTKFHIF